MRTAFAIAAVYILTGSMAAAGPSTAPAVDAGLSAEQQKKLLDARVDGGMGDSFAQFANMYLVSSMQQLGMGVGLMTSSKQVADTELESPFPKSYKPTLREFLDAITLQTGTEWKYDPSGKFVKGGSPPKELAIFEFSEVKRDKPFEVKLADGWKPVDRGSWVMFVPPTFPLGMDIHLVGTYSAADPADAKALPETIRKAMALQWAQRVNAKAVEADLKPAKVGGFDALYYEAMIPSQLGKDIRWRHWVFMDGNTCYFVVSTILPEMENTLYPDVQQMLASFKVKSSK